MALSPRSILSLTELSLTPSVSAILLRLLPSMKCALIRLHCSSGKELSAQHNWQCCSIISKKSSGLSVLLVIADDSIPSSVSRE